MSKTKTATLSFRKISIVATTLLFCTTILVSATSKAQTVFDIELVVFKRIDNQDMQTKIPESDAEMLLEDLSQSIKLDASSSLFPPSYSVLKRSEQKLQGVFNRLKSSPNLRPLYHKGWRQELTNKADTPWLSFTINDDPLQAGVESIVGKIRFSRNQGLLLETQLLAHKPLSEVQTLTDENLELDTDEESLSNIQAPEAFAGYFLLNENRKIKLNELNYFDHPNMGILLKVTPHIATLEEQQVLSSPVSGQQ